MLGVLGEAFVEDPLHVPGVHDGQLFVGFAENQVGLLEQVVLVEDLPEGAQLVDEASEGPDIDLFVVALALQALWRHVIGGPDDRGGEFVVGLELLHE
jgi:hypothetical protein